MSSSEAAGGSAVVAGSAVGSGGSAPIAVQIVWTPISQPLSELPITI